MIAMNRYNYIVLFLLSSTLSMCVERSEIDDSQSGDTFTLNSWLIDIYEEDASRGTGKQLHGLISVQNATDSIVLELVHYRVPEVYFQNSDGELSHTALDGNEVQAGDVLSLLSISFDPNTINLNQTYALEELPIDFVISWRRFEPPPDSIKDHPLCEKYHIIDPGEGEKCLVLFWLTEQLIGGDTTSDFTITFTELSLKTPGSISLTINWSIAPIQSFPDKSSKICCFNLPGSTNLLKFTYTINNDLSMVSNELYQYEDQFFYVNSCIDSSLIDVEFHEDLCSVH